MPSVTQSPACSSSKKRRRDDDDNDGSGEVQVPFSPQYHPHNHNPFSALGSNNERLIFSSSAAHSSSSFNHHRDLGNPPVFNLPRKVIPLPVNKRFRALDDDNHEKQVRQHPQQQHDQHVGLTSPPLGDHQHHHHQQQRQLHFTHAHPEYSTPPISPQMQPYHHQAIIKPTSSLLDPCHICHRKPTKKSDLDSFADCMGCGQRTCFVCIRQCQGWLGSGSGSTLGERSTSSTNAATTNEQNQQNFSTSFTMQDVDDDMDRHETPSPVVNHHHRPQKPHRGQNKAESGGGNNNSNNSRSGGDSDNGRTAAGGGGPEQGWSGRGHRDVICSRCCVERGSNGDVVCLGCLAGMEGT